MESEGPAGFSSTLGGSHFYLVQSRLLIGLQQVILRQYLKPKCDDWQLASLGDNLARHEPVHSWDAYSSKSVSGSL